MNLPQPSHTTFLSLINCIETGQLKIPQFQRDFVWVIDKCANLMDSIIKGYPIGTFIFWKTKERLRSIRNIGGIDLPEPPEGDYIQYVLDGQQRITAIYATLKGLTISRDNGDDDLGEMYVDLLASEEEPIIITDISNKSKSDIIKLTDLLYGCLTLLVGLPKIHHTKLEEYKQRIESYCFPTVLVDNAPIDVATDIFTRINIGGKPLSVFEIMVAKTFDSAKDFDLSEKYAELINSLENVDYETISDSTVLQTISVLLEKDCSKKTILRLNKNDFIDVWPDAVDAIEHAVDYFRNYYRIPVSQLLPYNALIVPFAYFFYKHKQKPTGNKQKYLQDFFWRTSLAERYSHSLETKIAQDIDRIDEILNNRLPKYDYQVDASPDYIFENGWFSTGRSYIKAILCLYAFQEPKSFIDDSIVKISNDWLKQANSKNYHHFFPKKYLEKKGIEEFNRNNILNITIVDDYLNKRAIGAAPPSIYMKKFSKDNPILDQTMKTHLINDIGSYGIWSDDYDLFLDMRAKAISKEIKKRII